MTQRKPQALKKLHGTQRPDRDVPNIADTKGMPTRSEGLSHTAIRVWNDLGPKLVELGLLGEVDGAVFGAFCQAYADYVDITKHLNSIGVANWYWVGKNGYRQVIPEVAERNKAFAHMTKLAPKFGLDPSARSGIDIAGVQQSDNSVEAFLFEGKKVAEG